MALWQMDVMGGVSWPTAPVQAGDRDRRPFPLRGDRPPGARGPWHGRCARAGEGSGPVWGAGGGADRHGSSPPPVHQPRPARCCSSGTAGRTASRWHHPAAIAHDDREDRRWHWTLREGPGRRRALADLATARPSMMRGSAVQHRQAASPWHGHSPSGSVPDAPTDPQLPPSGACGAGLGAHARGGRQPLPGTDTAGSAAAGGVRSRRAGQRQHASGQTSDLAGDRPVRPDRDRVGGSADPARVPPRRADQDPAGRAGRQRPGPTARYRRTRRAPCPVHRTAAGPTASGHDRRGRPARERRRVYRNRRQTDQHRQPPCRSASHLAARRPAHARHQRWNPGAPPWPARCPHPDEPACPGLG